MVDSVWQRAISQHLGGQDSSMNIRIIVVGLSLAILAWLSAYQLVSREYDNEVQRTRQIQSNILKSIEVHLTDMLQDANNVLLLMEHTYKNTGTMSPEVRTILSTGSLSRFISQAAITDAEGNFIFSFAPTDAKTNAADRVYFQTHTRKDTGALFIGPVVTGRITGQTMFHISRRINNPDGSFGGVAVLAVSTDQLDAVFEKMSLEKINYLLVGKDGMVRTTSGKNKKILGQSLSDDPLFASINRSERTGMLLQHTQYLDEYRFVSFRASDKYDLIFVASQLESDALALYYQQRLLYYGAAAIFTILLLLMMQLLYRASRRQKQLRLSVQAAMERAEYYLDMAASLLVALDMSGRVTMLNQRGTEMLGYEETELLGKDWFDTVLPPEHRDRVRQKYEELIAGKRPAKKNSTDMEAITRDGSRRILSWTNSVLRNTQGEIVGTLSSGVDVTERRHMEAELVRLANTDPLTGLSNRRCIMETAQRYFQLFLRYQRPLSICLMDVDRFKTINDTYGHTSGDQVLVHLADICRSKLRNADLCGRFGGEEFLFILPETPASKAFAAAERLRKAMEEATVETQDGQIRFTVSIGVVTAIPSDTSLEDLLRMADIYLYAAKSGGRNKVIAGTSAKWPKQAGN